MKFLPYTNQLAVSYENKQFILFNMLERNISKYSKENLEFFPKKKLVSNHIIDIVEHPFKEKKIIFLTNY